MSITNYGELKASVANFLARSDLTAVIPDFIALAQAKMYMGDKHAMVPALRIRAMHTIADLTPVDGAAALPADFLDAERLYVDESVPVQLEYLPPEDFWSWGSATESGTPSHYTIEGSTVRFQPRGGNTVKLAYYAKLTALSDDADTDWVLTHAPHAYLYGALVSAYEYLLDDARAAQYRASFASSIHAIHEQDELARSSGSTMAIRPRAIS